MDLGRVLSWAAERHPARRAVGGGRPLSYRQWDGWTNQLARALGALGVRPGARVVALVSGGEPLASLHLALQKLGAATVPLSTRYGVKDLAYCIGDAAPALVVSDAALDPLLDAALVPVPEPPSRAHVGEDPPEGVPSLTLAAAGQPDGSLGVRVEDEAASVMLYTSGTTGAPKGVPRSHRAELWAAVAHVLQAGYGDGEIALGAMPLFHTMGMRSLLASLVVGGTWVPQTRFDPERALEAILGERIGALYLVPTAYWALMRTGGADRAARLVRKVAYAGAPMTPALTEEVGQVLDPEVFVNHFGSTEVYTFSVNPRARVKPGCAGRAGVFSRLRLVAPNEGAGPDDTVEAGTQGQVIVSLESDEAFAGYWRRPDADARALRGGWYFTGDLARQDDEGEYWVAGRVDDMINSGGENLYPNEIEDALARCPEVSDVVVAGMPDEKWGQAVTAFVVPRQLGGVEGTLARIDEFVRTSSGLSSLTRPKRIVLVETVPKSAVGKVLRRELIAGNYVPLADSAAGTDPGPEGPVVGGSGG